MLPLTPQNDYEHHQEYFLLQNTPFLTKIQKHFLNPSKHEGETAGIVCRLAAVGATAVTHQYYVQ
jgi:hypothetical protein